MLFVALSHDGDADGETQTFPCLLCNIFRTFVTLFFFFFFLLLALSLSGASSHHCLFNFDHQTDGLTKPGVAHFI